MTKKRWTRSNDQVRTVSMRPLDELDTVELAPIESPMLARGSASTPPLGTATTVAMTPLHKPPEVHPRGPRRAREKLSALKRR